MRRLRLALVLLPFLAACSGSSPTAPTPVATPAPVAPAPAPVATTRSLTFAPASTNPVGSALGVIGGSRGAEAGKIVLAVAAFNLAGVTKMRGTLRWDRNLLEYDTWGEGEWFKQGGALVEWTFFTSTAGQVGLFLDRPTTLPGANGSGEIILIRLKPRAGVVSGTSAVQWDEPAIYTGIFSQLPLTNSYGGTITIQ
jgi:hypothetical protein